MKYCCIVILLLISFGKMTAQNWEIGIHTGGSNYLGDLSPDIVLKETKNYQGAFFKKNISPFFSHTFNVYYGKISGQDKNFKHLKIRNLDFKSNVLEFSYILEFNFFKFSLGLNPNRYTPYTFVGFGVFSFNPQTTYNGTTINLIALDTEGKLIETNKKGYKTIQPVIPFGGGFKFKITKGINLLINCGFRYTFTDYLDDVSKEYYNVDVLELKYGHLSPLLSDRSEINIGFEGKQRGRPDIKDWYYFYGFTISFQIRNKVCFEF